jgi:hypothetical protein
MSFIESVCRWEARIGVQRRAMAAAAWWMTWKVTVFGTEIITVALAEKGDLMGTAACIAAMSAPVAALTGYVCKAYFDSKAEGAT